MSRTLRVAFTVLVSLVAVSVVAHPHFGKTVTAKLPSGVDATITYATTPANESHAKNAEVGAFLTPRRPALTLSGDLTVGGTTLAAGDYTIGAIKNGDADWTMALHPGKLGRGDTPDASKLIKLESVYSAAEGTAGHMLIDITPGSGKLEGRAVLTLHFGSMFLAGVIS